MILYLKSISLGRYLRIKKGRIYNLFNFVQQVWAYCNIKELKDILYYFVFSFAHMCSFSFPPKDYCRRQKQIVFSLPRQRQRQRQIYTLFRSARTSCTTFGWSVPSVPFVRPALKICITYTGIYALWIMKRLIKPTLWPHGIPWIPSRPPGTPWPPQSTPSDQ